MIKDIIIKAEKTPSSPLPVERQLWAWGLNATGQLGLGIVNNRSSPTQVGVLTHWSSVSVGHSHTIAMTSSGSIWAWGANASFARGALGISNNVNRSSPVQIGTETNWSIIYAGGNSSFGIKTNGTLWAWGNNTYEQLGTDTNAVSSPVQVGTQTNWSTISSTYFYGANHTLALKTDGTLWAWGDSGFGQIGDSQPPGGLRSLPVKIGNDTNWKVVSAGQRYSMAIKTDGTLWGWGENTSLQLGNGTLTNESSPVQIGTETNWSKVYSGVSYTMAIKTNNTLWGWGINTNGRIGDGTIINKTLPVQIGSSTDWKDISISLVSTLALKTDGTLWAWGSNRNGQLGFSGVNRSSPVQIGTLNNWRFVSNGGDTAMALKKP